MLQYRELGDQKLILSFGHHLTLDLTLPTQVSEEYNELMGGTKVYLTIDDQETVVGRVKSRVK